MRLTERMVHDPMRCLGCGMGNTPNGETGEIGPFVDLEQEVGWNDHAYLCVDCAVSSGALVGMLPEDEKKDLVRALRAKDIEIHDLQTQLETTQRKLRGTQKRLLKV